MRKRQLTAWDQYLGTCIKCGKRGSVLESYCSECQKKHRKDFMNELDAMGVKL